MRRNPDVTVRVPERVSKARGGVTEKDIRNWFEKANETFSAIPGAMEALKDPRRVFNTDESCIQLSPPTGKVISITGWKNVYQLAPGPEKSNLTFLGTYNANGETVTPMMVYPYMRLPSEIASNIPPDFHVALTESGWMTSKLFYEFIANPFINWINQNNIERPVVLFVDGHKTHVTLQTSVLCEDNGIILYLLPPNTTHIMQPADVGPFRPMKHYWREAVSDFQRKHPGILVTRKDVAPLLKTVLDKVASNSIINGFRKSGIHPFNVEAIDFTRCLDIEIESDEISDQDIVPSEPIIEVGIKYNEAYECIRHELGQENLEKCLRKQLHVEELYSLVRTIAEKADIPVPPEGDVEGVIDNNVALTLPEVIDNNVAITLSDPPREACSTSLGSDIEVPSSAISHELDGNSIFGA